MRISIRRWQGQKAVVNSVDAAIQVIVNLGEG